MYTGQKLKNSHEKIAPVAIQDTHENAETPQDYNNYNAIIVCRPKT